MRATQILFHHWLKICVVLLFFICTFAVANIPLRLMLLDVDVNQRALPEVIDTYLDSAQHLWVSTTDLTRMGLKIPAVATRMIRGKAYVRLDTWVSVHYLLDQKSMHLKITAPTSAFTEQMININEDQTENNHHVIRPDVPGSFLNYDLSAEHTPYDNSPTQTSALTELGLFNHWGTGSAHYLFQHGNPNNATATRLDTTWTQDQPENLASWRLGDAITSSAPWSGATRFGGIQYATNFDTQPNLVTFPLPNIKGEAVLPSTVNLLVNNTRSQQVPVNPGPFIIHNVPVVTGAGTVSVITQDVLGREQIITLPYYSAPQLLKPGLSNFSYEGGFVRDNYAIHSNDYGRLVTTATKSEGINETLTLIQHGELLKDQQTIGSSANYLWQKRGILSFSIAASHANGQGIGELIGTGFNRQATPISYGAQVTWTTRYFTQVGLLSGQLSPIITTQVFTGYDMGHAGSLAATYTYTQARNNTAQNTFAAPSSKLVTLSYSKSIFKTSSLTVGMIDSLSNHDNDQLFAMMTIALDTVHTASINTTHQNGKQQYAGEFTKALPVGNGYGYQLYQSHDGYDQSLGNVTVKNDIGQYNATISRLNDQNNYQLGAQGSIIHFGGVTQLSRNFDSGGSFGLVEVPGFEDVRVYDQNQLIGTTDHRGNLFIPNLLPYQKNKLAIEPKDLPIDTRITTLEKSVTPYFKSGSVIEFPVQKTYSVIFHLMRASKQYVPTGALLEFAGHSQHYIVGEQGTVYFDDLQQNRIQGTAYFAEEECHFEIHRPTSDETVPDLGEIICH